MLTNLLQAKFVIPTMLALMTLILSVMAWMNHVDAQLQQREEQFSRGVAQQMAKPAMVKPTYIPH